MKKQRPLDIQNRKNSDDAIICLTAYSDFMTRLIDAHADLILVGDSVGNVLYGMETTLPVTLEMMSVHGRAVANAARSSCVIVDMPFGSYQESLELAFRNAAKIMAETGCDGIKLEGGSEMAETIAFLTQRGIPVMAHIGLQPQLVNTLGGFKAQGKDDASYQKLIEDARAVQKAGAFSVVVECVVREAASELTQMLSIPTIGIGASNQCDGQILVTEDMLGLTARKAPKFVKKFADLAPQITSAIESYAAEVNSGSYPTEEHEYHAPQNQVKVVKR